MSDWVHVEGTIRFKLKNLDFRIGECFDDGIPTGSEGPLSYRVERLDQSWFAPEYKITYFSAIRDCDATDIPAVVEYLNRATTKLQAAAQIEYAQIAVRKDWQPDIDLKWDGKVWKQNPESAIELAKQLQLANRQSWEYRHIAEQAVKMIVEMADHLPEQLSAVAKKQAAEWQADIKRISGLEVEEDEGAYE